MSASGVTDGRVVYWAWEFLGCRIFSDLISRDYMRRWVLRTPLGMLRLHHILRGDEDRHFHDHPFDFVSLILWGGYVEHRPGREPRECLPGSVVARRAEDLHLLKMLRGTAWTLVLAGPIRRQWGFQTEDGWVVAGEYDAWKREKERAGVDGFHDEQGCLNDVGRARVAEFVVRGNSGDFVPWPHDAPRQHNAFTEPCDMWTGPCCCGAWHEEGR